MDKKQKETKRGNNEGTDDESFFINNSQKFNHDQRDMSRSTVSESAKKLTPSSKTPSKEKEQKPIDQAQEILKMELNKLSKMPTKQQNQSSAAGSAKKEKIVSKTPSKTPAKVMKTKQKNQSVAAGSANKEKKVSKTPPNKKVINLTGSVSI